MFKQLQNNGCKHLDRQICWQREWESTNYSLYEGYD